MKNQEKIKLVPMKFPEDKNEIGSWEKDFDGTEGMNKISHFILEDNTFYNLGEVIESNYEIIPIGENEVKLAYVAKNEDNKIVAWILLQAFELDSKEPEMFFQYIVIHPEFQHKGIGTEIAKQVFLTPENFIGVKPKHIFSYIHKENYNSQKLFQGFNFSLYECGENYLRAYTQEPKLTKSTNPAELGD